jgi:hypothetical protein
VRAAAAGVPSPRHGRGQSDQRDRGGWTWAACRVHGACWFPSLGQHLCKVLSLLPLQDSAPKVFDEIPARSKNSNFRNFQIGLVIILDRDSETIFVRSRGGVLLQGYFEFGVVLCFRFKLWTDFERG